jgi:hypothetical protein
LILEWRFEPPFIVTAPYFYLFIAILNDHTIDLVSIEIHHVLRLPFRFSSARLFHLKEPEVSEHSEHNDSED